MLCCDGLGAVSNNLVVLLSGSLNLYIFASTVLVLTLLLNYLSRLSCRAVMVFFNMCGFVP